MEHSGTAIPLTTERDSEEDTKEDPGQGKILILQKKQHCLDVFFSHANDRGTTIAETQIVVLVAWPSWPPVSAELQP